MINFKKYNHIILDFDGVILDSNFIKEKAINKVANKFLDNIEATKFVDYFINHNGLPREIKIKKYFNDDIYNEALKCYNEELDTRLKCAIFTLNLKVFIKKMEFYNLIPYVLSGGDRAEIISLLKSKNYLDKFKGIMGGPYTKYENLEKLNLNGGVLYIGDSLIDYEVALKYNFDFIFMYGYTQFKDWKEYFSNKKEVKTIKDFNALT